MATLEKETKRHIDYQPLPQVHSWVLIESLGLNRSQEVCKGKQLRSGCGPIRHWPITVWTPVSPAMWFDKLWNPVVALSGDMSPPPYTKAPALLA